MPPKALSTKRLWCCGGTGCDNFDRGGAAVESSAKTVKWQHDECLEQVSCLSARGDRPATHNNEREEGGMLTATWIKYAYCTFKNMTVSRIADEVTYGRCALERDMPQPLYSASDVDDGTSRFLVFLSWVITLTCTPYIADPRIYNQIIFRRWRAVGGITACTSTHSLFL